MLDEEILVATILREQTGIEVSSMYRIVELPDREYLAALALLDRVMDTELPKEVRFVSKLCFSDARAKAYYRRIFQWWLEAEGDTEPPSLEWALRRTYTKSQGNWTWESIWGLPTEAWPFTVVRRAWKDCTRRDEARTRLMELLNNGERAIWKLIELSRIDDAVLRGWFLACDSLPRVAKRRVKRWPEAKVGPARRRVRRSAPSVGFLEVFSADLDEATAGEEIVSLSGELGWSDVGSLDDLDEVPHRRFVVVWADSAIAAGRMVVAMREEETTLIVLWLEKECGRSMG